RRLHLLLEHERARFRLALPRLVLGEAALHDGARQDAHQTPALLDDRNPLEILLLEKAEGTLEPETGVEGEVRRLGDPAEGLGAHRRILAFTGRCRELRAPRRPRGWPRPSPPGAA